VKNKKHQVTEIVVGFSGPLNPAQADSVANFRLAAANGKGLFTARNSPVMKLRSAAFNPANDTVTLVPRQAFALAKSLQLTINGTPPSGLQDSSGQFIDGANNGMAGGNAVAVIRRTGVTLNAAALAAPVMNNPTAPAAPVMSSPTAPEAPVTSNPTTPTASVMSNPTPPAAPGGTQFFPYAAVDAVLNRGEGLM
jgi:hypothetical protein